MALIKCPDCGHDVSDVAPACVNCGRPMSADSPLPAEPNSQKSPMVQKTRPIFKVAGAFLVILALIVLFSGNGKSPKSTTAATPDAPSAPAPAAPGSVASASSDDSAGASDATVDQPAPKTLPDAISAYLPLMTDKMDGLSKGAAILAMWEQANKITWSDLTAIPRTSAALVMKDSSQERGKLICTSGSIVEISADDTPAGKVFEGEINDDAGNGIFRFVAVRSTGELVENSYGSFCGVVIGRYDYSNSMNGVTHAIQLVGMFKLPRNMK